MQTIAEPDRPEQAAPDARRYQHFIPERIAAAPPSGDYLATRAGRAARARQLGLDVKTFEGAYLASFPEARRRSLAPRRVTRRATATARAPRRARRSVRVSAVASAGDGPPAPRPAHRDTVGGVS